MIMSLHRRGLGQPLVPPPTYANCSPLDPACVAANEVLNTTYNVAVQTAEAQTNFDQCQANAQNALPGAQMASVLASCNAQFTTQAPSGAAPQPYVAPATPATPPPPPQPSPI